MRMILVSMTALALTTGVPAAAGPHDNGHQAHDSGHDDGDHHDKAQDRQEDNHSYRPTAPDWQRGRSYSYNRPDPRYNGYYANNYYRSGSYYRPRQLYANDRIYRGNDNRYYCRRSDGTTGLVVGAISGGVLGDVIAPGGSKTLGAILGGSLGAILGSSIDRGNVTCR